MRLIDAEEVIKAVDKHTFETKDGLCLDDDISVILEDVPTIEERKVGKWEETDDGWDGTYYVCSECGCPWTLIDGTPKDNGMNFCPNCGARMEDAK